MGHPSRLRGQRLFQVRCVRSRQRRMQLEQLDQRRLFAADLRSLDGSGNNLLNPDWGSSDEAFLRKSPAEYSDGVSAPAGLDRLSAREISNLLSAQGEQDLTNDRNLSAFVYAWGQFLDHDLDLTLSGDMGEVFSIEVPTGDPYFDPLATGDKTIPLLRSNFESDSGTSKLNPRQQLNSISAFVDGSQIYGSTEELAIALRTMVGGKLKTSAGDLLPTNEEGIDPNAPPNFFVAGDIRANENLTLISIHSLFVREHNRLAEQFAAKNPSWTDEQLYQEARRWVIAELQSITYNEFLPAILGQDLPKYRGYNPTVNPGIANEFATAAYRFGHSMLGPDTEFMADDGAEVREPVALRDAFFNPDIVKDSGIDSILKYLASDRAQEIDTLVIDDLRNFLFGPPGSGGLDLVALNIQRGRDHGLADYNATRVAYGLKPVKSFADITADVELQKALQAAYGSVDNIDLWVGGLAEDHVRGGSVGPLFQKIIQDQFMRLRDGDRFWYEKEFRGAELRQLQNTSLSDIMLANTELTNLQENVFLFKAEAVGQVVLDANADGRLRGERGLEGITIELRDAAGALVATTQTDRAGNYKFTELDIGQYEVRVLVPTGMKLTTSGSSVVNVTKGDTVQRTDFGLARSAATNPPPKGQPHHPRGANLALLASPTAAIDAADELFRRLG
jgi:peroxidase